ncbi:MAG TPA: gamma-glutamyltransferase family protein, partial [Thermoanaerobaculia bacterium]|nr:gamma-glutamyltransferase family protein [Thermoanaerobaculia bacterium]
FPEAGNLGGGGFAVVRLPDGEVATLDFREVAPAAATREMYLEARAAGVEDASLLGGLAAAVPGSPAGLHELHRRFGRLPWPRVVAPAERLAREGFAVDGNLHRTLSDAQDLLARFPESAEVWLPGGEPPPVGATIRLPDLAATLRAYAERGPEAITAGPLAERAAEVSRRHGGILTAADLSAYRPVWRDPVRFEAFGWRFASMGLPSSGAAILGQVVGLLERLGWAARPRFGADRAHLLTEAFRGAFADRFLLGDPATSEVSEAELLAPAWIARRAAGIDPERAADSASLTAYPGTPPRDSANTTHLSAVDAEGGAVALTTTLNGLYGSKVWVPGLGFLNNEMDDFATVPGEPNMFGLIQGEANAVAPGRRMLSSMSPTIAWRAVAGPGGSGIEVVAVGGRGGSRIPTNVIQVLLHLIVDGDHLQLALDRPRLHHQWLPDRLQAEPDALAPETRAVLEARGHAVEVTEATAKVNAARVLPDGVTEAAVDPRGPGAPAVVAGAVSFSAAGGTKKKGRKPCGSRPSLSPRLTLNASASLNPLLAGLVVVFPGALDGPAGGLLARRWSADHPCRTRGPTPSRGRSRSVETNYPPGSNRKARATGASRHPRRERKSLQRLGLRPE